MKTPEQIHKTAKYTLSEISKMNKSSYTVKDHEVMRGRLKNWNDRIEILVYNGFFTPVHKETTRKFAYKFGLCEGIL